MRYHKIKNVDKSICTKEQIVAYNYAFWDRDLFLKRYDSTAPEFVKNEFIINCVHYIINSIQRTADYEKFSKMIDIDSVFCALNAGLKNYLEKSGTGILCDYAEIGKTFPAYYLK